MSTESNHGPTAGLNALLQPESAAVIVVCCRAEISGVRTDFSKQAAARRTHRVPVPVLSTVDSTLMRHDFSYLDSLLRHSLRVSGKTLKTVVAGDDEEFQRRDQTRAVSSNSFKSRA